MCRPALLLIPLAAAFVAIVFFRTDCIAWNEEALTAIRDTHTPEQTVAAKRLADLGDTPGVLAATIACVIVLVVLRRRRDALLLATILIFGCGVNALLKLHFADDRPHLFPSPYPATGYSFPSGHAQAAVGLYGTLALIAWRWFVALPCALAGLGICWSRVYLGVHWPTDVIAGCLLGAFVVAAGWSLRSPVADTPGSPCGD